MKKRLFVMAILTGVMLTVSFSVFAVTSPQPAQFMHISEDHGDFEVEGSLSRLGAVNDGTVSVDFSSYTPLILCMKYRNRTDQDIYLQQPLATITIQGSTVYYINHSEQYSSDLILDFEESQMSNGLFYINGSTQYAMPDGIIVPANSTIELLCMIGVAVHYDFNNGTYITPVISTFSHSYTSYSLIDSASSELGITSNQLITQEATIHQQELQWYQANEQAINAVGLDNFNFSSGTLSGFQVMQQQFGDIWSALGDLNLIFIFTLTMSLATYITRHFTRTKATEHVTETTTLQENLVTGQKKAYQTTTVSRRIR